MTGDFQYGGIPAVVVNNDPVRSVDDALLIGRQYGRVVLSPLGGGQDDSARINAIMTACAAKYPIILLGSFAIIAGISIPSDVTLLGIPGSTTLTTSANVSIITIAGENIELDALTLVGSSAGVNQHGVNCSNHYNLTIGALEGVNLGGACFYASATLGAEHVGPRIELLQAHGCGYGILLAERAEYVTIGRVEISGCGIGAKIVGGNASVDGGNITDCTSWGVYLGVGSNDSHGTLTGVHINHNSGAIYSEAISNGFVFNGCHVYDGTISFLSSHGIHFDGGILDPAALYFDGSRGTVFDGVLWPGDYANAIYPNYNGHSSTEYWLTNNYDKSGARPASMPVAPSNWTPLSETGLQHWCTSRDTVPFAAGLIQTMVDDSGNSHSPTQANAAKQPTKTLNQLNGYPSIDFNGTTSLLTIAYVEVQPLHGFIVADWTGAPAGNAIIDGATNDTGLIYRSGGSNTVNLYAGAAGPTQLIADATPILYDYVINGVNSKLAQGGGAFSTADAGAANPGGISIGAQPNGASPGRVKVYEYFRYDHELSAGVRALAVAYLKNKYNL